MCGPQLSHKRPSALRNSLRPFGLTSLVNEGGFSFFPKKNSYKNETPITILSLLLRKLHKMEPIQLDKLS